VSDAQSTMELVTDLSTELRTLVRPIRRRVRNHAVDSSRRMTDFVEYSLFRAVSRADGAKQGFAEEFQIASFHPDYHSAMPPG